MLSKRQLNANATVDKVPSFLVERFAIPSAAALEFAVRILRVSSHFCTANRFLPWRCLDCSGILPAEAELMYINEVERLDGFGQEIFPVKVTGCPCPCTCSELVPRARVASASQCHVTLVDKLVTFSSL